MIMRKAKRDLPAHEIYNKLGVGLSVIMKEKKLSNLKVQYLTGIDNADISRIRNGQREILLSTLQRLADGLGVTIKDLLGKE